MSEPAWVLELAIITGTLILRTISFAAVKDNREEVTLISSSGDFY